MTARALALAAMMMATVGLDGATEATATIAAPARERAPVALPSAIGADVTLLTYNVKGLPWPVASGRPAALDAVAQHLLELRRAGRQPHMVALQEAFVDDAKAIGRKAGYRYVAFGPNRDEAPAPVTSAADRAFNGAASFFLGERLGKRADSGLAVFSDYPILAVRHTSYSVCAGYDCLANKGAMAALIAVPGLNGPLTLIDTHLNSSAASGASKARAIYAYRRQVDQLTSFIDSVAPAGSPVLVAGDFNVGANKKRQAYFADHILGKATSLAAAQVTCAAISACARSGAADVAESIRHGKDWLMFRGAPALGIRPLGLAATFGHAIDGSMLSDHIGVTVAYRLAAAAAGSGVVRLASR